MDTAILDRLALYDPASRGVIPQPTDSPPFKLVSDFQPAGDQPQAIAELNAGVVAGDRDQVLLGVTGSGKTFTVAHMIQEQQRPAVILAPNKTLAAQLYAEMKGFFPDNAVEYFVSYYDYYQPEAYVPRSDTYVEKEASVNEEIDRMRRMASWIRAISRAARCVAEATSRVRTARPSPARSISPTACSEVWDKLPARSLSTSATSCKLDAATTEADVRSPRRSCRAVPMASRRSSDWRDASSIAAPPRRTA